MFKLRAYLILLLLAAVIFMSFFRLGSFTLFDVDEAVFAEATKEMTEKIEALGPNPLRARLKAEG